MLAAAGAQAGRGTPEMRDRRIVAAMMARQKSGDPVHRWGAVTESEMEDGTDLYQNVSDVMSTDLFTVGPDDPITLAAGTMTWKHIRHLPVEDAAGKFVGLISDREIIQVIAEKGWEQMAAGPMTVKDIMDAIPMTVDPRASTVAALKLMLEHKLDCLPAVKDGELMGIVSNQDMMVVLSHLLKEEQRGKGTTAVAG
jgi:CBS domain-containing protein